MSNTKRVWYFMKEDTCMAKISFDLKDFSVNVENYTDILMFKPFGNNNKPTYATLESFISNRCMPKTRANVKDVLLTLNLDYYDEFSIIKRTHGYTNSDGCWIKFGNEDATTYEDIKRIFRSI